MTFGKLFPYFFWTVKQAAWVHHKKQNFLIVDLYFASFKNQQALWRHDI